MRPSVVGSAFVITLLAACGTGRSADRYGFVVTLGRDTISLEGVTRRGNEIISDEADHFPRVRLRHTVATLSPQGEITHLQMDIREPGAATPEARVRRFTADVGSDSVRISVRDSTGTKLRAFSTHGSLTMPHVSQMYSLIELYIDAALINGRATPLAVGDSVHVNQYYADREFDHFPLHEGWVHPLQAGKVELWHDWLAGIGLATIDSAGHMLAYSGAGSTYKVDVARVADLPDVAAFGTRLAAAERAAGAVKELSPRDTTRGQLGRVAITVDYGRPYARGRALLGNIIPFGEVWRTGANAATQFTTSAHITLGTLDLPAGTYTLWTAPQSSGKVLLIVNRQTGQWGTGYDRSRDLGSYPLTVAASAAPVEQFTISVLPGDATHGTLVLEWGTFRWTAPIVVK
jgi:hypothetical protein